MATVVVGDVHGCAAELARLLDRAGADRVVLVGDLYTKGPDPAGVWRLVRDHGLEAVVGNHDQRLLDQLAGGRPKDAEAAETVRCLDAFDPAWRAHLRGLPVFLEPVEGCTVVHAGLHPSGDLARTTRAMALAMRRWPERRGAPYWWEDYAGERRVVYGHDARRGLVRVTRGGVPWVMGLDTGCVYGGVLTGWLPAEDRLVQVVAGRVYHPVGSSSRSEDEGA